MFYSAGNAFVCSPYDARNRLFQFYFFSKSTAGRKASLWKHFNLWNFQGADAPTTHHFVISKHESTEWRIDLRTQTSPPYPSPPTTNTKRFCKSCSGQSKSETRPAECNYSLLIRHWNVACRCWGLFAGGSQMTQWTAVNTLRGDGQYWCEAYQSVFS